MQHTRLIAACEELARLRKARQRQCLSSGCLHLGQPAMLEYVRSHPGCTQKEMADEARVTPASIAASFKRMENAGFISRCTDVSDTRCNRVYITAEGEKALSACLDALEGLDSAMLKGIDSDSLAILQTCLDRMIENMQEG